MRFRVWIDFAVIMYRYSRGRVATHSAQSISDIHVFPERTEPWSTVRRGSLFCLNSRMRSFCFFVNATLPILQRLQNIRKSAVRIARTAAVPAVILALFINKVELYSRL